jgi:hypothetical protein
MVFASVLEITGAPSWNGRAKALNVNTDKEARTENRHFIL